MDYLLIIKEKSNGQINLTPKKDFLNPFSKFPLTSPERRETLRCQITRKMSIHTG
jgi:hypothetical protein